MALKDIFGTQLSPPPGIEKYEIASGGIMPLDKIGGLTLLLSNILKITIYGAGLFALINFLVSGIQYLASSGNPETIKQASNRIWMSVLGLTVAASSLIIAAVLGIILFNDPTAILIPIIPEP